MSFDPAANRASSSAHASSDGTPPAGRLAVLAAYAVAAGCDPDPVRPRSGARSASAAPSSTTSVSRHGLSLTSDARAVLAAAGLRAAHPRSRKAAETVAREVLRRLGPLGVFDVRRPRLEVYALGYLLDRYITRSAGPAPCASTSRRRAACATASIAPCCARFSPTLRARR